MEQSWHQRIFICIEISLQFFIFNMEPDTGFDRTIDENRSALQKITQSLGYPKLSQISNLHITANYRLDCYISHRVAVNSGEKCQGGALV